MLHPLNPPTCIDELLTLVNFQRKMLEFAEANPTYTDAALRVEVSNDFVDWILRLKSGTGRPQKIANRFIQELTEYAKCSLSEKRKVLQILNSDQNFYSQLMIQLLLFPLLPSKSQSHERAKKCLCEFYELLGIGYPPILAGNTVSSPLFNKESVVRAYKTSNPNIEFVCPCCDSAFTDSAAASEQGYTLEHYFPKSLYPSICMHPLKLNSNVFRL